MAFCSKCGTKLTEGAKFCPKCGNSVQPTEEKPKSIVDAFKEGWQQGTKESQNKPSENDSLNTWEKIALGVSGFIALSGIWGGFANGLWIVAIISLCAIGAICAVFMGTIEKKYAWTTAIVSFLVVCGAIGASTDDDKEEKQKQAQTEQKQESPAEKKESNPYAKFAGTYTLYDDYGGIIDKPIEIIKDGRFIAESGKTVEPEVLGSISILSDKAFSVYLSEQLWVGYKVKEYQGKNTVGSPNKIPWGNTLVFDLSEKRMYESERDYKNRDVSSPTYMKFKFTKN